jgi:hypothetical protein
VLPPLLVPLLLPLVLLLVLPPLLAPLLLLPLLELPLVLPAVSEVPLLDADVPPAPSGLSLPSGEWVLLLEQAHNASARNGMCDTFIHKSRHGDESRLVRLPDQSPSNCRADLGRFRGPRPGAHTRHNDGPVEDPVSAEEMACRPEATRGCRAVLSFPFSGGGLGERPRSPKHD